MSNKEIREVLDICSEKAIIGHGTYYVNVKTLNRRKEKGREKDWMETIAVIEEAFKFKEKELLEKEKEFLEESDIQQFRAGSWLYDKIEDRIEEINKRLQELSDYQSCGNFEEVK